MAAALEPALEVGRVRGDADRRVVLAAARVGVAGVAREDAARACIQPAATAGLLPNPLAQR